MLARLPILPVGRPTSILPGLWPIDRGWDASIAGVAIPFLNIRMNLRCDTPYKLNTDTTGKEENRLWKLFKSRG